MSQLKFSDLKNAKVHFIGIGGSGMSGIARILVALDIKVSGSDIKDSQTLEGLRKLGVEVFASHSADNIAGREIIVISSAISASNVELKRAKELNIPMLLRAEALAILMSQKRSVAVAGTHGKTTTTSMLTVALQHCGVDPSFAIGATVSNSGTNAHHGSGDVFVAEADESDGSFLVYKPFGAIITNIELDHVDHFADEAAVDEVFTNFVSTIQSDGFLVICGDDLGAKRLIATSKIEGITLATYGEGAECDLKIDRVALDAASSTARITWRGRVLGELQLSVPGRHNILNAAASLTAALLMGYPAPEVIQGLKTFTGARRRFELKGKINGITVIDDYGHHPTEIRVTLETAQNYNQIGRVIAIFQPHRFSRTAHFLADFAKELSIADKVFLLEVYAASENPIQGVTSLSIAQKMEPTKVTYEPSMPAVIEMVVEMAKPNDLIITLGAGDVNSLGPLILEAIELREKSE